MTAALYYPRPPMLSVLGPGHNVVESSAGTGKTFLLEHLFIDLILGRAVPIEQILVVTYTEKATAELVLRVRTLLGELVHLDGAHPKAQQAAGMAPDQRWLIDRAAQERLRQALLGFDRANISTIHGFCQRVLREHSFVQGRLFDEALVAEEVTVRRAFRELVRDHGGDPRVTRILRAWLASDRTVEELETLLCQCAAHNLGEVYLRPEFDEDRLTRAVQAWPGLAMDGPGLRRSLAGAGLRGSSLEGCLRRMSWLHEAVAGARGDALSFLAARPERAHKSTPELLEFLHERLPTPTSTSLSISADSHPLDLARLAAAVSGLRAAVVPFEAAVVSGLLPSLRTRAAADKRRAGVFDFADMLALVGRALDDDSPVREALLGSLRRRYRFALIDEFQDTDDTQWSIFRRVFVEGTRGHALTVIGDPKQAIYGFRGANVLAYLEARRTLDACGAGRLQLDRNFRSTAALIQAQNLIFAQDAGFFRPDSGITYDLPVTCGAPQRVLEGDAGGPAKPVVVLGLRARDKSLRAGDAQTALQAAMVAELRVLLAPGAPLRLRGRAGGRTTIRPRDVFILTFTNGESWDVGEALGRAGIPFAFYKRGKLFESSEASDVLCVLRAVAEPEDRGLCARAFLTRFFDLPLEGAAACLDPSLASEPSLRLHDWAALARRGDIPGLFASLLDDSGILRREVFANAGERALTNTMHVLELLQGEWARSHATLPELVELLSAYTRGTQAPPGQEADMQRLETDQDAVQILTVHTAKGLEADVVFLYGGTGEPRHQATRVFGQHGARVLHVGRLDDEAKRAASADQFDERSRLLYVALTRARYRLYLPHYPTEMARLSGPYRQANDHLGRILGSAVDPSHALFEVRSIAGATAEAPPAPPEPGPAPEVPGELLETPVEPPELAAIRSQRSGFVVTSYSAVKRAQSELAPKADPHAEGASELGQARRLHPDELPGGAETGIFLHEILAAVSLPGLAEKPAWEAWSTGEEVQALLHKLARRHGRPPAEIPPSARMVHAAYTTPIRLGGADGDTIGHTIIDGLASATRTLRELEFLFPIPARLHPSLSSSPAKQPASGGLPWRIERGVVKGFIDLLFEHAGRVYVCDWKSDSLPGYGADVLGPHCQESYDLQARIYTLAALRLCGIATRIDFERRWGGVFFCFLRGLGQPGEGIHYLAPHWPSLLSWESAMLQPSFWGGSP